MKSQSALAKELLTMSAWTDWASGLKLKNALLPSFKLLPCLVSLLGVWQVCTGEEPDAEAQKKPDINFREPHREYKTIKLGRWTIDVEEQLVKEAPEIAAKATQRLR